MHRAEPMSPEDVRVEIAGRLPAGTAEYAREKITTLGRHIREPVLYARVRLTEHADPAVRRPVTAQANLDVNGRLVRAQIEAPTAREAVDLLEDRLRHRLERLARHWEAQRGRRPSMRPHEWQHNTPLTHRPSYFPRPAEDRKIIGHKSFTLAAATIDEAAFEMNTMDYDFHLFTEIGSGQDSVLYHAGPTGYRLAQVQPVPLGRLSNFSVPLTVSGHPAPLLSTTEAVDRLNLSGLPFLFFLHAEHARGSVLYRRYDGHYGLITPAG